MSDNLDPIPISLWSVAVGAQIAAAIIDIWKWNLNRRRLLTGYEKILNGEKISGWRIALSSECIRKKFGQTRWHCFLCPFWPSIENDDHRSPFSLLIYVVGSIPDGRRVLSLCRYSLVSTDVSSTILQIIYNDDNYDFGFGSKVTDRIAALVFVPIDEESPYCLILIDTISKSYRRLTLASPVRGAFLYAICPGDFSKRRINALFKKSDWSPGALRAEFYEVPYEIPISNDNNVDVALSPRGWQSISIANGDSIDISTHVGIGPQACVLYDESNPNNVNDARVITYDRHRNWRIETLNDRLTALRSTDYGAKLLQAVDSLDSLQLPDRFLFPIQSLRNFKYVSEYRIGESIYFATLGDGLLHRVIYPPTLERTAADAFCRSNRRFNFGDLKKLIGFDIFDGILEEEAKKDYTVIYFQ